MGHVKIISYSNILEIYEYEYDIIRLVGRGEGKRKVIAGDKDMGIGRKNTLQKGDDSNSLGKRPDNARRASMAFRRIVASNLGGSSRPILVTLTYRDNLTDLKRAYRHYSSFVQSLRHKYGKTFKYICVPEFQKRGAVHFHALFWGIPEEVFLLERRTRTLAKIWGKGFVYLKETDGDQKLSFYLSKYMTKAFLDPRLKNQKSYVASRNIKRPLIQSGSFPVNEILHQFGVIGEPVIDKSYLTKWLGRGRYRIYETHD